MVGVDSTSCRTQRAHRLCPQKEAARSEEGQTLRKTREPTGSPASNYWAEHRRSGDAFGLITWSQRWPAGGLCHAPRLGRSSRGPVGWGRQDRRDLAVLDASGGADALTLHATLAVPFLRSPASSTTRTAAPPCSCSTAKPRNASISLPVSLPREVRGWTLPMFGSNAPRSPSNSVASGRDPGVNPTFIRPIHKHVKPLLGTDR
jgi:hypothetical protein